MNIDYKKVGLKCGIEIHQRLDTKKLFCDCDSSQKEQPILSIRRRLRPVAGELGDIDPAALYEFIRGKNFIYRYYSNESCLVECDEEPPHEINKEALNIGLQICKMLNCNIPEEIHVMRKTVIDGSNTSGFQRTAIIGLNGKLKTSFGSVDIPTVCLEEEAARIEEKKGDEVIYKLNGLGIPLIEITTSVMNDPYHVKEVAETLGLILRSTKVQRGIGSIRQDLNVSISEGSRVEIKGVQELRMIPKIIENEVRRQIGLIEIKKELKKRGYDPKKIKSIDATEIFAHTRCDIIRKSIAEGNRVFAIVVPQLSGLMKYDCGSHTLGKELAYYVQAYGIGGIIHSDENLDSYQIRKEFDVLKDKMKPGSRDLLLIFSGKKEEAKDALIKRLSILGDEIPEETRVAYDEDSKYMRPLPGAQRMYPETDIPPVRIDKKYIESIVVKESLVEKKKTLEFKIPKQMADQIVKSWYYPYFEEFSQKFSLDQTFIANTFLSTVKELSRDGLDIKKIKKEDFEKIFEMIEKGIISKDVIYEALEMIINGKTYEDIEAMYSTLSKNELEKIVKEIIKRNKGEKESVLMGMIMKVVRGRASGKDVNEILKKALKVLNKK
jgi:glutamyl-tRNA(Gln) amidotransferase subunit E